MSALVVTYKQYPIRVTSEGNFYVDNADFLGERFNTLDEAKKTVDKFTRKKRQKRKEYNLPFLEFVAYRNYHSTDSPRFVVRRFKNLNRIKRTPTINLHSEGLYKDSSMDAPGHRNSETIFPHNTPKHIQEKYIALHIEKNNIKKQIIDIVDTYSLKRMGYLSPPQKYYGSGTTSLKDCELYEKNFILYMEDLQKAVSELKGD
jgi:hypothetical protein